MSTPHPACIVDAYSAGNQFTAELVRRGHPCVHVQSVPEVPAIYAPSFRPADFAQNLVFRGSLDRLLAELAPLAPACVMAGMESGVLLADALSEALGLVSNGTAKSRARRNKFAMWEAARAAGVPVGRHISASEVEDILRWQRAENVSPVVLKPAESAGTDRVEVCADQDSIRRAFAAILGQTNLLGIENREVLAQELFTGPEHVINTVSSRGRRCVTDMWRVEKIQIHGGPFVYDRDDLLTGSDGPEPDILDYVFRVLDALEIAHGPAHVEIKLTPEGPRLLEVGARVDGGAVPEVVRELSGRDPFALTADAYLDPDAFAAEASRPYRIRKRSCLVSLISHQDGIIRAIPGADAVRQLPSFSRLLLRSRPGAALRATHDVSTLPGMIFLVHDDPEVIERDVAAIRRLEADRRFFDLE